MVPTERPPVYGLNNLAAGVRIKRDENCADITYKFRRCRLRIPHVSHSPESWLLFLFELEQAGVVDIDDALDRLDCAGDFTRAMFADRQQPSTVPF